MTERQLFSASAKVRLGGTCCLESRAFCLWVDMTSTMILIILAKDGIAYSRLLAPLRSGTVIHPSVGHLA